MRRVAKDGALVGAVSAAAPAAAPAPGARRVAVILVNFAGVDERRPWTSEQVRERVFTGAESTSGFFYEESHGQLRLGGATGNPDGDVYGWYAIDATPGCDWARWAEQARARAFAQDGFTAARYDHVMYVFPRQPSCAWAGLAYLPGAQSWINGELSVRVTAHELGHNLGLNHAGSFRCTGPGGAAVTLSSSCTLAEYGDPFDVMGGQGDRHNHGWHLEQLGLLRSSNVRTVDASGSYAIRSALMPTDEATTLRIPRTRGPNGSVRDWYYLEIREPGGVFDDFGAGDFVAQGVSIRLNDDPSRATPSRLLDANPAGAGFADAPLGVGQTFRDGPLSVTTTHAGAGSATVDVSFTAPPLTDAQPPSEPTSLRGALAGEAVDLEWEPALDDTGVVRYAVYRDGVQVGTSGATRFHDLAVAPGDHVYTVHAEDAASNRGPASAPLTLSVPQSRASGATAAGTASARDVKPPRLRLQRRRARHGRLLLRAHARDNERVERIELWIDGRRRRARRGPRLSFRWDARGARSGRHRLAVRAVDSSGNRSSLSVSVSLRGR